MGIPDSSDEKIYSTKESSRKTENWKQDEKSDNQKEQEKMGTKSASKNTRGHFRRINERDVMKHYNKLCDLLTSLKKDGHKMEINPPQLVVCGAQSSGKTSLLETVAGRNFLPKGTGIQTRCPIEIQLRESTNGRTWVQFLDHPDQIFTDMEEVKEKILKHNQKIMEEVVHEIGADGTMNEKKRVVSEIPITLKLFSPDVPNLTLVDLPGFVPCPKDSEPKDLKTQIEIVVMKYISRPNSIILPIVPASQELETNSTTEFVELADPKRERTVLIITKLDTAVSNNTISNVTATLEGKNKKYQLGIIGVVNRLENKTPEIASQIEQNVLETYFPKIANKHGIPFFKKWVSELLISEIEGSLPDTKRIIREKIENLNQRITDFGEEDNENNFFKHLNAFSESFRSQINGSKTMLSRSHYPVSTKVHEIFENKLLKAIDDFKPCESLKDEEIAISLANSKGVQGYMQLSSNDWTDVIHWLLRTEIMGLEQILITCAKKVYNEMNTATEFCHDEDVKMRYKHFTRKTNTVTSEFIRESFEECKKHLTIFIESESIGYTTDLYFYKKINSSKPEKPATGVGADDHVKTEQESVVEQKDPEVETESDSGNKKKKRNRDCQKNKKIKFVATKVKNYAKKAENKRKRKSFSYDHDHNVPKTVVGSISDAFSEGFSHIPILGATASHLIKKAGEGIEKWFDGDDTEIDSDHGKVLFQGIRQQIELYFVQVKWSVKNYVPKAILNTLVYGVEKRLKNELTNRTMKGDNINDLMRLSDEMETEKRTLGNTLMWYQEADETISLMEQALMT
ncbi:Dynamin-related protein 3B [Orchesella cincta]|uniref:Dynamin-related protein 3B n=1 Tax=Orchesella cincta TaxID=48709 RepID=A0A1D2MC31_ORCCI|nr:Dynamin-related protein 3B [Orchesella cincta]